MRTSRRIVQASLVTLLLIVAAACGGPAQPTAPAPSAQPTATAEAATAEPTLAAAATAEPTPAAEEPPTPTALVSGPTATPFPLEAGWWDNAVCYELFVRSFYDSDGDGIGDLPGLIEKLDYLNDGDPATTEDLGVNCVWLMPISQSPSYHGYDVTDFYTIEEDYGTNEDFKRFVDEAHARGINVVIDLVLNHTSVEHPWFKEAAANPQSKYRDWFIWEDENPGYPGPWGEPAWHSSGGDFYYGVFWSGMPDLNYRNPEVTQEALAVSRFWVEEMGVDGFRLDAIKHLIEDGEVQEHTPATHAWLQDYRDFLQSLDRDVFTVGEALGTPTNILATYYPDQLDTFFEFNIAEAILRGATLGSGAGYLAAVARVDQELPFQRYAPLLTNHDQNRAMSVLGGDIGKARIAATALLTLPGLPFLYYGEEIGMTGVKPDEDLRTPMHWSGDAGAGFTTGRPWRAPQSNYASANVAMQTEDPASLLSLYRQLIRLHQEHQALGSGEFIPLESGAKEVAAFLRHTDEETLLVVLNFGKEAFESPTLSAESTPLAAGTFQLTALLGSEAGAALTAGDSGALSGYIPLPTLEAQTGYIFKVER